MGSNERIAGFPIIFRIFFKTEKHPAVIDQLNRRLNTTDEQ